MLLNAASAGHYDICVWLLQQKDIDINKRNLVSSTGRLIHNAYPRDSRILQSGTTPLLAAASHGHCRVVSALLNAKANCANEVGGSGGGRGRGGE